MVRYLASLLVDEPDKVEVNASIGEQTVVFNLRAAKTDIGKLIGRQGRAATAMRHFVMVYASRNGKRAVLEILE